jgi:hypothetical protein
VHIHRLLVKLHWSMHGEAPNIQQEQEQDEARVQAQATQQAAQRTAPERQQLNRVFLPGNISVTLPPRVYAQCTREEWRALWATMLAEATVETGLQVSCSRGTPRHRLSWYIQAWPHARIQMCHRWTRRTNKSARATYACYRRALLHILANLPRGGFIAPPDCRCCGADAMQNCPMCRGYLCTTCREELGFCFRCEPLARPAAAVAA